MEPQSQVHGDGSAEADRERVRAVATGSAEALGWLYDRHARVVFGLARRILGTLEDAEEVVQDVFAQVWRDAARYDQRRATVAGWIIMLTRTRAIDRLRSRVARPDQASPVSPDAAPLLAAGDPSPEQAVIAEADARGVRDAMHRLPEEQRGVVLLAYYEGLTHSEISTRTGVPLGTVKTRLRNAVATLRGALAQ